MENKEEKKREKIPLIVTVKEEREMQIWNLITGKVIGNLAKKGGHKISQMIKTNDNKILTIGDDNNVNIYY